MNFQKQKSTKSKNVHKCMNLMSQRLLSERICICVMCKEPLNSTIMLVQNVGNTCKPCSKKTPNTALRNTALKFVIKLMVGTCSYQNFGCTQNVKYTKIKEHEQNCPFKTMSCLCTGCSWLGSIKHFKEHFLGIHKNVVDSRYDSFRLKLSDKGFMKEVCFFQVQSVSGFIRVKLIPAPVSSTSESQLIYDIFGSTSTDQSQNLVDYNLIHSDGQGTKFEMTCKPTSLFDLKNTNSKTINVSTLNSLFGDFKSLTLTIKPQIVEVLESTITFTGDKIKECLECPVCYNIMRPPFHQCQTGHSFCGKCKQKLSQCPSCGNANINTRNYALENLASDIYYDCENVGCGEKVQGKSLENHEKNCLKRKLLS